MFRLIFMVACISASAMATAGYLSRNQEDAAAAVTVVRDNVRVMKPKFEAAKEKANPVRLSGVEYIPRDGRGHYAAEFKLNNHRVHGVIDTGATTIAINETVARRAGIRLRPSDFIYEVRTANGKTSAARTVLHRVTIGSIRVSEVEAMVLKDGSLDIVLIGMSFMNRLRGFEHTSGKLVLRR